jgi:hypothetical protein
MRIAKSYVAAPADVHVAIIQIQPYLDVRMHEHELADDGAQVADAKAQGGANTDWAAQRPGPTRDLFDQGVDLRQYDFCSLVSQQPCVVRNHPSTRAVQQADRELGLQAGHALTDYGLCR